MTETFYEVLGVEPDASTSDIEAAYRERIKETHPDLNDDEDADVATQRVIEARDVLTDEDERSRYDELGHEAYVGNADGTSEQTGTTDTDGAASHATREAGWGDAETGDPSESSAAGTNAGPYERRHRERTASERVRQERTRTDTGQSNAGRTTATGASATGTATSSSVSGAGTASASGRTAAASSRNQRERERIYDAGSRSATTGYDVRKDVTPGIHPLRSLFAGTSLSLTVITFFLYPVMLFSTVFPPFPLVVNLTVGLCTLFLIGYLQSQPSVGVLVFGTWSLLVPIGLVAFNVNPTGIVGLIALGGAWLPFGFSALTLSMLRI